MNSANGFTVVPSVVSTLVRNIGTPMTCQLEPWRLMYAANALAVVSYDLAVDHGYLLAGFLVFVTPKVKP